MRLTFIPIAVSLLLLGSPAGSQATSNVQGGRSRTSVDIAANVRGAASQPAPEVVERPGGKVVEAAAGPGPAAPEPPATGEVTPEAFPACGPNLSNIWAPEQWVACESPAPGAPAGVVGPAQYAANYFRSLPLPVPQPTMSAPEGIAGARHQLDLRIPPSQVFTESTTDFGALVVRVSGRFVVDWGDGNVDTYFSAGAPWPHSALEHYWEDNARYDITVTANWSATWSFGATSGVLGGLTTSAQIPQWQVLEAQAVLIETDGRGN